MRARVRKDSGRAPLVKQDGAADWCMRAAACIPRGARVSNPLLGEDPAGTYAVLDTAVDAAMPLAEVLRKAALADGALIVLDKASASIAALSAAGFTPFFIDDCEHLFAVNFELPAAPWLTDLAKAVWSTKYVNDLPDSAFLYVEPGGEKDGGGKTTPRTRRKFPYRDDGGAVDLPHLRNALARIPQSSLDQGTKDKLTAKAKKLLAANAEKSGELQPEQDLAMLRTATLGAAPNGARLLPQTADVIKAEGAEAEERFILGIVLEPDAVDSQGDTISAESIRAAAHRYMEDYGNIGLQHQTFVNGKIKILETYVLPADCEIGGQAVKAGTWLMAFRVCDDAIWAAIKSGVLTGLSIGGTGIRIEVST